MHKALILSSLLLCAACANFNAAQECQKQIGPRPYAAADMFGLAGALAVSQSDARQEWNHKMGDCMAAWKAANP